jgi:peptidoglycan/xylan/chitin deacetylase (PgdA/CDA1 family)
MLVGLHGWAHRDWRRLGATQVIEELVDASRILGELTGRPVTSVALPYGSYDRHVLRRLRGIGMTRVYTCDGGPARPDAWLQPRTSVRHDLTPDWLDQVVDDRFPLTHRGRRLAARLVKRVRG